MALQRQSEPLLLTLLWVLPQDGEKYDFGMDCGYHLAGSDVFGAWCGFLLIKAKKAKEVARGCANHSIMRERQHLTRHLVVTSDGAGTFELSAPLR